MSPMTQRPLRVVVDARCLNVAHLRGMGKSLYELVRRTAADGTIEWHLFGDRPDQSVHNPPGAVNFTLFDLPGYRFHTWEQIGLPLRAWRLRGDKPHLLHAPATVMPWWQPMPTVVTIHDTIPWMQSDAAFPSGFYRDRLLPAAYARASAIVTISECSRRDIVARWPLLEPKIHTVPLGVDQRYLDASANPAPIVIGARAVTEPYLLYFGGGDPRKRLDWALDVWRAVAPTGVSLIVCGLEPSSHDRVRQSVQHELVDRLFLAPFVHEAALPRLYQRAAAVLYPTLYEGFGLPAIEAQAVGTPVIFGDIGSLSELKGPAAHVVPLHDKAAWVTTVAALLQARRECPHPHEAARQWARQFSWDLYVERMLAVYRTVSRTGPYPVRLPKRTLDRVAP
jgi:glycosyltransferase involved in cell wall biosynthesis